MFTPQVIIKPVSLMCNLMCDYCYYGPICKEDFRDLSGVVVDKVTIMSDEILYALINAYSSYSNIPNFIWHGGEPLLAGISFYEKVRELQKFLLHESFEGNSIQTNATLITDEWANFFSQEKFTVGVSFDGYEKAHNAHRITPDGKPTAQEVIKGIKVLQKFGINPSIISTITKANVLEPKKLYKFLRSLGITKMKFSHLHERERFGDLNSIAVTPDEYADFMIGILDTWIEEDDDKIVISELRSIIQILTGGNEKDCIYTGCCDQYLNIEYNGLVSWCDTISKPKETVFFGNIKDGFENILNSKLFKKFQNNIIELHNRTKNEPWYPFLSFGCIGDYSQLPFNNNISHNTYADGWIKLVRTIAVRLKEYGFDVVVDI